MVFEALADVKAPNNSPSDLTVEAEVDMQELMDSVAVVQQSKMMDKEYVEKEDQEDSLAIDTQEDLEIEATMAGKGAAIPEATYTADTVKPAQLTDFKKLNIVGKGSFGKVYKVEHIPTGKIYAMKTIRKDVVLENESMDSLQLEMQILNTAKHEFLIGMDYVFTDEFRVYFIMDYIDGGELFRHLLKVRRFKNDQAQFMIA